MLPPALQNRPKLRPMLMPYLSAFYDLCGGRQYSMAGPQPITIEAIRAYTDMFGITGLDERDRWLRLIRRMDATWLTEQQRLMEAQSKK